jgi:hypothetical protein
MANDVATDQLINTLVLRAARRLSEGKSRFDVIAELIKDGASKEVAEAIVTKGELINPILPGYK